MRHGGREETRKHTPEPHLTSTSTSLPLLLTHVYGQFDAFQESMSFFCLALLFHVLLSLFENQRRSAKAKAVGVLQAVFMLQPAIEELQPLVRQADV